MSSSPFTFPHAGSMQALHEMGVQLRRSEKEIPASVRASLIPLIPVFTLQTRTYGLVENVIPDIWNSETLKVPFTDDAGFDLAFVSMDGTADGSHDTMLYFQIMRNGLAVADCGVQGLWDVLGSDTPHQFGMWAGQVEPGDSFSLRAAQSNGDPGSKAVSTDVTLSLTGIHFTQSDSRK